MYFMIDTAMVQIKQSLARPMYRFCLFISPVINVIFLYEMFLTSSKGNFVEYCIISSGMLGMWSCICFSSVGDINRERYSGTLSILFVAPCGFFNILVGKILGNSILAFFSFFSSYVVACIVSQNIWFPSHIMLLVFALFIFVLVTAEISLLLALLLTMSRKTSLYMNLLEIPIPFLCGFVFPPEQLPKSMQILSKMIPLTWISRLINYSIEEQFRITNEITKILLIIFIESLVIIGIVFLCYNVIIRKIQRDGNLEVM